MESLPWSEFLVSLPEDSKEDSLFVDGPFSADSGEDRNEPWSDEVRLPCSDDLYMEESTESLDRRPPNNSVWNEEGSFPDWGEEGINTLSPDMYEEDEDGRLPDRRELDES